jgi:hypothetical protein
MSLKPPTTDNTLSGHLLSLIHFKSYPASMQGFKHAQSAIFGCRSAGGGCSNTHALRAESRFRAKHFTATKTKKTQIPPVNGGIDD